MNEKIKDFVKSVKFTNDTANDYYGGVTAGYRHDKARSDRFNRYIKEVLSKIPNITEQELVQSFASTSFGRLELIDGDIHYTAGQFYDLEVPEAIAWALDYIQNKRGVFVRHDLLQISKLN